MASHRSFAGHGSAPNRRDLESQIRVDRRTEIRRSLATNQHSKHECPYIRRLFRTKASCVVIGARRRLCYAAVVPSRNKFYRSIAKRFCSLGPRFDLGSRTCGMLVNSDRGLIDSPPMSLAMHLLHCTERSWYEMACTLTRACKTVAQHVDGAQSGEVDSLCVVELLDERSKSRLFLRLGADFSDVREVERLRLPAEVRMANGSSCVSSSFVASSCLLIGSTASSSDPLESIDPARWLIGSTFIFPLSSRGSSTGLPMVRRSPRIPIFSRPLKAPLILARQTGH